jgi:hypothetical protein
MPWSSHVEAASPVPARLMIPPFDPDTGVPPLGKHIATWTTLDLGSVGRNTAKDNSKATTVTVSSMLSIPRATPRQLVTDPGVNSRRSEPLGPTRNLAHGTLS